MQEDVTGKLIVHYRDMHIQKKMYRHLIDLLEQQEELYHRPIIILCIGSDRYIGDALGPLVGSFLEEGASCIVYGNLDNPVHAGNLVDVIQRIHHEYQHPIIIAIDACLGKNNEIGNLEIWKGSLEAGIAVGARLPCVGDISMIGVVNGNSHVGYLDLQNTPLSIVMKLSRLISAAVQDAIHAIQVHRAV